AAAVAVIVGYELEHQFGHSHSDLGKALGAAVGQMAKGSLGLALNQAVDTEKKKKPVRTDPKDLTEQLTLEEAKSKPRIEEDEIMPGKIRDPNYPKEEWKKMEHIHEKPDGTCVDIHYWENRLTGEKKEFKFKNN
ncbi:MAG: hypothetical protein JSR93_01140, partial [Verrucomicrobia bacterium]|nr:hypothetical protein [Verrucomicrobiota bacterium]